MKVSHTLLISNITNVIVLNLFNVLFQAGKQKSSDKSNQTQHALSACDKFSQRVTAHTGMTDSVAADGADNQSVDIGIQHCGNDTREEMEIPRAILRSHETWNNYYSFFLTSPLALFQDEWTTAVDMGGCDGTPGANSSGS